MFLATGQGCRDALQEMALLGRNSGIKVARKAGACRVSEESGVNQDTRHGETNGHDRWASAALVVGLIALVGAIPLDYLLFRWLVWDLQARELYGMLTPYILYLLPGVALLVATVALIRCKDRAIVAVGILAAVAAVVITLQMDAGKQSTGQVSCLSNVRQLALAHSLYVCDYDGRFPPGDKWTLVTLPYTKNLGILCCPGDYLSDPKGTGGWETSYTMNADLSHADVQTLTELNTLVCVFEGTQMAGGKDAAAYRHRGGLNVGYADWHVRYLTRDEFVQANFEPEPH